MADLSETQVKVMRYVRRRAVGPGISVQIAGHGRAPWLSACRALVRKGYMRDGSRTGHYALTELGGTELAKHEVKLT